MVLIFLSQMALADEDGGEDDGGDDGDEGDEGGECEEEEVYHETDPYKDGSMRFDGDPAWLEREDGTFVVVPVEECPYKCAIHTRSESYDLCGKKPIECSVFLSILWTVVYCIAVLLLCVAIIKAIQKISNANDEKKELQLK